MSSTLLLVLVLCIAVCHATRSTNPDQDRVHCAGLLSAKAQETIQWYATEPKVRTWLDICVVLLHHDPTMLTYATV